MSSLKIGIQSGLGSFNHQAALLHLRRIGIEDFELISLHTSPQVLAALDNKEIDLAQFAWSNTLGGLVIESTEAAGRYHFDLVAEYQLEIAHALMIHPETNLDSIETIMSRDQVFKQCQKTLERDYPHIKLVQGQGQFMDPAKIAELLGKRQLPIEYGSHLNVAVLSCNMLAQIHGLKIVQQGMRDSANNFTTFRLVKRQESPMPQLSTKYGDTLVPVMPASVTPV